SLRVGPDLAPRSGAGQKEKARAAIDAGADLVVGHHPHVQQEVERYGHGFIAYSLGDFVFDHPELSVDGALLEVTLAAGRPVRLVWLRTRINPELQPEVIGESVWGGGAPRTTARARGGWGGGGGGGGERPPAQAACRTGAAAGPPRGGRRPPPPPV